MLAQKNKHSFLKQIFLIVTLLLFFCFSPFRLQAREVTFQWFGQACFLIVTSESTKIITDPVEMGGYKIPKELIPDIVTVSHEHSDHNKVDAVSGSPIILRGLASGGKEVVRIDQKVKGVRISTVASYHDNSQGAQRGLNAIFVFEFDGIRAAHLGDLGHILSDEQVKAIGEVDILMIPVGGKYTISGEDAEKVVAQLKPKMAVIPMHFKTDAAPFLPDSGEDFARGKENVKKISGNSYRLDLNNPPRKCEYIILNWK